MFVCGTRRETLERLSMTYVYGKRQTGGSCVSQKDENLRFSTCLTLLRSYSIHLGNRQERGLNKSSFSVFWQKENFILPFAVNFMLNREIKHRVFFSRGRQRGSRDLTFPAFAVCRPPFLLEEDIFPVWRERENVSICSPFLLSISPF